MQHLDDTEQGTLNVKDFKQFDDILSYLGFRQYQIYVFIIVGLIGMCDAGETQAISIVFPILEKEWQITDNQKSLLGSLIYIGYFIGSLFSGAFADNYGRRPSLIYSSGIMFICGIVGAFMPNFVTYMILRIILVTCVGFIIPVSFSMLAENTPMESRGIVLVTIGFFYTAGELTVCLLTFIFMPNLVTGNWRAVLCWASVPALITFIISIFLLLESPRYHLIKGNVREAQQIITKIFKINNKPPILIPISDYSQMSMELIRQEKEEQGDLVETEKNNFFEVYILQIKKLLANQFRKITLIVWYQWFVNTFVYAGVTFLLPLTLQKLNPDKPSDDDTEDLTIITLSCLGELPVIFVAMILVNIKLFGRKNSLGLSYFGVGVVGVLIVLINTGGYYFGLMIFFLKMFISFSFTVSYQFVSELYPTYMRASGIGFASSVGRIGSIIMPWIVVYLNDLGTFLSYGIFGIISLLASVATMMLPFDTHLRALDKIVTQ